MNFKTLLLLSGIVGLGGCSKAPELYIEAAEQYAEDSCQGIVDDKSFKEESYLGSHRDIVMHKKFYFTCITENGSSRENLAYKDIPVKYFNVEKTND